MSHEDRKTIGAQEVLVLDTCTFIKEIGLMSRQGSALKHYLCCRGTQFVVPQAAVEEYERHLIQEANKKVKNIQESLRWLAYFFNPVAGWSAPGDAVIEAQAKTLAMGHRHGAILLDETKEIRARAERRYSEERPPGHTKKKKETQGDCRIWEQCLELLSNHDVVFVSQDKDFQSRHGTLHPQLDAEAKKVGAGRSLRFYSDMTPLLGELKSEMTPIADDEIFHFIYESTSKNRRSPTQEDLLAHANSPHDELSHGENAPPREDGPILPGSHDSIREIIQELQSNSECRPTATGRVKQTRLATEDCHIIEVRLEVEDKWESLDGTTSAHFELSGSCRYHLGEKCLDNLWTDRVNLQIIEPDGSVHPVKGGLGVISLGGGSYRGTAPFYPERVTLE
ncbi:MAG: hypothetical protein F4Z73_03420 [Synechococcus sp. SB0668_bin_13]|nr:hypothetical protein [Synechococcus sp. SB0668_bin_13]